MNATEARRRLQAMTSSGTGLFLDAAGVSAQCRRAGHQRLRRPAREPERDARRRQPLGERAPNVRRRHRRRQRHPHRGRGAAALAEALERYSNSAWTDDQLIVACQDELGAEALDLATLPRCSPRERGPALPRRRRAPRSADPLDQRAVADPRRAGLGPAGPDASARRPHAVRAVHDPGLHRFGRAHGPAPGRRQRAVRGDRARRDLARVAAAASAVALESTSTGPTWASFCHAARRVMAASSCSTPRPTSACRRSTPSNGRRTTRGSRRS